MFSMLKRLWFPLVVIFLVYTLFSKTPRAPDARYLPRNPKFQEPLRVSNPYQSLNDSNHQFTTSGYDKGTPESTIPAAPTGPGTIIPRALLDLRACPRAPNRFTGHIRLSNLLYNISMKSAALDEKRNFWNPTVFALPSWAQNQYVIVSMVTPHGETYRRNVLCEANICHPKGQHSTIPREKYCTQEDLDLLGPSGGLRCVTPPIEVDVPPTPAESCSGEERELADILGFHDPRLFYSGRGEPVLMVVSQCACLPGVDRCH